LLWNKKLKNKEIGRSGSPNFVHPVILHYRKS